jgi:hypothetical protein
VLVERCAGMEGLWSLIYAAQRGVLRLALDPHLDRDLSLTYAAIDLGEAIGELEWAYPQLPATSPAVDLGAASSARVDECREALAALLSRALELAAEIVRDGNDLDTADALAVARVIHLITSAHDRIAGRLP